jgi:hypothetical protein
MTDTVSDTPADAFTAGSILVEESAGLPNSLVLPRESHSSEWPAMSNSLSTFEKQIQAAGWTFFFMAGEIKATVFGFDRQKTLRTALQWLIAQVKALHCNSIEITKVTGHSFLKVPYVSVFAHPRHLQKGLVFSEQQ